MDQSTGQSAEDPDPRRQRIRRMKGGTAALAGLASWFIAMWVPWLNLHLNADDPDMAWPRDLSDLSTGYWVHITLGLLAAMAAAAASRRVTLRRVVRRLALPAYALAIVAVLNTAGMIRWWGGPLVTGDSWLDDRMAMPTSGMLWALASAQLLGYAAVVLAPTTPPAPRQVVSDQDLLRGTGFRG